MPNEIPEATDVPKETAEPADLPNETAEATDVPNETTEATELPNGTTDLPNETTEAADLPNLPSSEDLQCLCSKLYSRYFTGFFRRDGQKYQTIVCPVWLCGS